jgi:hypothetical protein
MLDTLLLLTRVIYERLPPLPPPSRLSSTPHLLPSVIFSSPLGGRGSGFNSPAGSLEYCNSTREDVFLCLGPDRDRTCLTHPHLSFLPAPSIPAVVCPQDIRAFFFYQTTAKHHYHRLFLFLFLFLFHRPEHHTARTRSRLRRSPAREPLYIHW